MSSAASAQKVERLQNLLRVVLAVLAGFAVVRIKGYFGTHFESFEVVSLTCMDKYCPCKGWEGQSHDRSM